MYQSTTETRTDMASQLVPTEEPPTDHPDHTIVMSDGISLLDHNSTRARAKRFFTPSSKPFLIGFIIFFIIAIVIGVVVWKVSDDETSNNNNHIQSNSTWVTFYHLTDIHGWINGHPHDSHLNANWGDLLSLGQHMKEMAKQKKEEFYLFDTGDLIEGTGLSDATPIHGTLIYNATVQLSHYIPYGGLTLGNHDVGYNDTIEQVHSMWEPGFEGAFVTTNTNYTNGTVNRPLGVPYRVITTPLNHRILVLGYIFDFLQNSGNTHITFMNQSLQEQYFKEAMQIMDVDIIVTINHADPINAQTYDLRQQWRVIREYHPETPLLILGGHAHQKYTNQWDPQCLVIESGKYFETIGVIRFELYNTSTRLSMRSPSMTFMDTNVDTFIQVSGKTKDTFLTQEGKIMQKQLKEWTDVLKLDDVVGCSPQYYDTYLPAWVNTSFYNLWIEKIIPSSFNLTWSRNRPFYITSSSSIRAPLYAGNVTTEDILAAQPFNDFNFVIRNVNSTQLSQLVTALFTREFGSVSKRHKIYTCDEDEDHTRDKVIETYNIKQWQIWKQQQQQQHRHLLSLQGVGEGPIPPKNITSAPYYATIDTFYVQTSDFITKYANITFDVISSAYFNTFFTQKVFSGLGYPELTKSELYPGLNGAPALTATQLLHQWIKNTHFKC